MPTYDFECPQCGKEERTVTYEMRLEQTCRVCGLSMQCLMPAPMGRMAGRIPQGGGPDRFTADVLGIPLKELPEGLKS
jgi:hypothetical protein